MGEDDEGRRTVPPSHRSATFALRDLLKGDPLTSMPRLLDAAAIEREMKVVRQLFEPDAFWIISCALVEHTAPDAQTAFRSAFTEFVSKSGAKIAVITVNAQLAEMVRVQARRVGVELTVVPDYKDATAMRKEHDAKRPKKP